MNLKRQSNPASLTVLARAVPRQRVAASQHGSGGGRKQHHGKARLPAQQTREVLADTQSAFGNPGCRDEQRGVVIGTSVNSFERW